MVPSMCPSCGASLPVPPGATQITCRYCQNVINVERKRAPLHIQPFGSPGAVPSRTLYIDPGAAEAAAKAGKAIGVIVIGAIALPILIPLCIFIGPRAFRAVRPFPVECGVNDDITVSGNYETTGPIVTSAGTNCKLHIKNSKLKGSSLVKSDGSNVEIWLENVTLDTTDAAIHGGTNTKVHIVGSTLTSASTVFESDTNLQLDADSSTIESKGAAAVKAKYNLKATLTNTKVRAKKPAFDTDSNFTLTLKKASELTSTDGPAVKASSGFKLEMDGGKIDGGLLFTSGANIEATGVTITAKDKAISASSSLRLDFTDGSITSTGDDAVAAESSLDATLTNVKIQGQTTAIATSSNGKIKALKKTRIVSMNGIGVTASSSTELNLNDAAVEGATKAFKGTSSCKFRLAQGARLAGKKGGIECDSSIDVDGMGATIDGGSGPAVLAGYVSHFSFKQGALKGVPALQLSSRPSSLDLDGTRIDGEQKIPAR